jgi:hypothetical protein
MIIEIVPANRLRAKPSAGSSDDLLWQLLPLSRERCDRRPGWPCDTLEFSSPNRSALTIPLRANPHSDLCTADAHLCRGQIFERNRS